MLASFRLSRACLLGLIAAACLAVGGCPRPDNNANDNENGEVSEPDLDTQRVLDKIEAAAAALDTLTSDPIDPGRLADLAAELDADPAVEFTELGAQGLAVQCTNGMRLMFVADPCDDDPNDPDFNPPDIEGEKSAPPKAMQSTQKGMAPKATKTILFNPHYWERKKLTPKIEEYGNAAFAQCGMSPFEVYKGEQCTLAVLRTLSDYGVIHLYSHGIAWPSGWNLNAVYMLTGQTISAELAYEKLPVELSERRRMMTDGRLAAGFFKFQLATETAPVRRWMVLVSPQYLAEKNDLGTNRPLVYQGFCFSYLGAWPQKMTEEGVGANLGFDWWVKSRKSVRWAALMYRDMGKHTAPDPLTLGDWYNGLSYRSYHIVDHHYGDVERDVTLKKGGSDGLTLWESTSSRIRGSLTVDNRIRDIAVYNDFVLAIDQDNGLTGYAGGSGTPARLSSVPLSMHSSGRGVTISGS
ncbi:MAG: hypothetical protein HZB38_13825, partial [Planctomycetes bacterium]|nr:hypothetical protein [Planctomycetota bacterium]